MVSKPIDLGILVACLGSIDLLLLLKLRHRLPISTNWVKIRLHTKNQLPRLPGSVIVTAQLNINMSWSLT